MCLCWLCYTSVSKIMISKTLFVTLESRYHELQHYSHRTPKFDEIVYSVKCEWRRVRSDGQWRILETDIGTCDFLATTSARFTKRVNKKTVLIDNISDSIRNAR